MLFPTRTARALALTGAAVLSSASAARLGAQAPAPASAPAVVFTGEVRTRSEVDRPGAPVGADAFTYLRSRLGVRVAASDRARIVLQVQDSRVLGAERGAAGAADVFALHQGYLELGGPWKDVTLAVRAGRQEIALGNERLVGAVNWSNTGRAFDGARVLLAPREATVGAEPWAATAFVATMEERGRRFGTASPAGGGAGAADHLVAGLFASRALGGGAALEGTLLFDDGAYYRAYQDARRTTLDARLRAPRLLGLSVELEGAVQAGRQRYLAPDAEPTAAVRQDVRAWLLGARVGLPAAPGRRATAGLGVDVLSGDATPGDGRYGAFATMYGTNHPFYGLMDVVGDPAAATRERGLVDAMARGSLVLSPVTTLRGELHRFTLATGSERHLGWEADVVLPVRLSPAAGVELGYSAFRAGRGAAAVGLGDDGAMRHWAYLQLRAGF
ncbi:MAG TPA: alginate export family protein [Gemmatimonadaceae bacterium]|nr:alginate export family protein [Gemmatimonadaceae bacterium]